MWNQLLKFNFKLLTLDFHSAVRIPNSAMERVYDGMIDLPNGKFDYKNFISLNFMEERKNSVYRKEDIKQLESDFSFATPKRSRSVGDITHPLDQVDTPSLCRLFESDTHACSRRKGDKHFETKSFPFTSDQV